MAPTPVGPKDGIAWVTGASSGIGRALALKLAAQGFTVVASARGADDLTALEAEAQSAGTRIVPAVLDVTDRAAAQDLIAAIEARHGPIALAVLNAGIYLPVDGLAPDIGRFTKSFAVNLDGTVNCLAPLIERMVARRRGQIAIVSSVAGYSGLPTSAAYGATKAGLTNLAESLKFDLDRADVLIQIVHPGFVETPATAKNPFPMPCLVPVETAAARIAAGLASGRFEITFPRRFTYVLKLLRMLPYGLYFPLVARATGWRGKRP